ncbi:MAG: dTDP-4-dehydrorhamnose reductase [Pseudomonadota bacterium]
MKLLIVGANGQVGSELALQVRNTGFQPVLADCYQVDGGDPIRVLDITDPVSIEKIFREERPDLLINAAAYTQVDRAETEKEVAFAINRDAPGLLARFCAKAGIAMIHISTDYVFDGKETRAYTESFPLSPTGIYGQSKAEGDEAVRKHLPRHLIVRTSWVYGVSGQNFVKTMLRLGKERSRIGVVADQIGSPTAAGDLAAALLTLAGHIASGKPIPWGIYHYCGLGVISWFDFAVKIFEIARQFGYPYSPEVSPITTAQYPTPACRPAFSALDCSLIGRCFDIHPVPWQESLSSVIEKLLSQP